MPAIHQRIESEIIAQERTLWTAITSADPKPELERLSSPNAVFLFPKKDIVTVDELGETFTNKFHRFDDYDLQDVRVIVIDLMAGIATYRIRATQNGKEYVATGTSTWGQGSDAEWRLMAHQETLQ
ncbi:nuclear transport factor 2 family protein [Aspergillus puulaauensis]|uniref:DUF4440 domain-containing protein n=1 Tax=Aspergillus puulaauensis TaxID=1220207 RepID=A0A7R7XYA4_9EURO|nr:uncharacterized protein APUU_80265S [Aspergillus puulaauensis]BCS29962.1 hypothetical protein APUU_80265S [Aspergillus puulaauensis]